MNKNIMFKGISCTKEELEEVRKNLNLTSKQFEYVWPEVFEKEINKIRK